MFKDQCISVTELRTKTKHHLKTVKQGEKYIFVNNKPVAVLIDIEKYETLLPKPILEVLPDNEITPELSALAAKTKKLKKSDLTNL